MGNIPNPNLDVDQLVTAQTETIETWRAIMASDVTREVKRRAAAAALTSSATNWEWFRSEWHKKAIARDATDYRDALADRVIHFASESADGRKFIKALSDSGVMIEVGLDRYPTLANVSRILDPSDGNVTFRDKRASDRAADKQLAPTYRARAKSLSHDDWLVLGVMIGVRNVLAHSSKRSVDAMNDAIRPCSQSGDDVIRTLARGANRVTRSGIGAYLMAEFDGVRRVEVICERLLTFAPKFRI